MATTVRAKFRCYHVTDYGGMKTASLNAVYSDKGENADYAKATPAGKLEISIDSGTPAAGFFEPGKDYYLTFEAAQ